MKHLIAVYLIPTLMVSVMAAQTTTPAPAPWTPQLREGINVEMPLTSTAVPIPEADKLDAVVASVTADGQVFLGTDLVRTGLVEKIRASLSGRADSLYIKADARAPYAAVVTVLDDARSAGVDRVLLLLTTETGASGSGTVVSPRGFEVTSPESSSTIAGTWVGEKQGSPWLQLDVTREKNGDLSGTAVFFILDRTGGPAPPRVLERQNVRLVDPKLEGNVFSFQVRNQQGQVTMNPSSGEVLHFQMKLDNERTGRLKSDSPDSEAVTMVKK
jgi:biopolymer transport protein ExbD